MFDQEMMTVLDFETEDLATGYKTRDRHRSVRILQAALFKQEAGELVLESHFTDVLKGATERLIKESAVDPQRAQERFLATIMRARGSQGTGQHGFGPSILHESGTMTEIFRRQLTKTISHVTGAKDAEELVTEAFVVRRVIQEIESGRRLGAWNAGFDEGRLVDAAIRTGQYGELRRAYSDFRKATGTGPFVDMADPAQQFLYENVRMQYLEQYGAQMKGRTGADAEAAAKKLAQETFDFSFIHTKDIYDVRAMDPDKLTVETASEAHVGFHRFFTDLLQSDDYAVRSAAKKVLGQETDVATAVQMDYKQQQQWQKGAMEFIKGVDTQNRVYKLSEVAPSPKFVKGWRVETLAKALSIDMGTAHDAAYDAPVEADLYRAFDDWRTRYQTREKVIREYTDNFQFTEAAAEMRAIQQEWFTEYLSKIKGVRVGSLEEFQTNLIKEIKEDALNSAIENRGARETTSIGQILEEISPGGVSQLKADPGARSVPKILSRAAQAEGVANKAVLMFQDEVIPGLKGLMKTRIGKIGLPVAGVMTVLALGDFNLGGYEGEPTPPPYGGFVGAGAGDIYHSMMESRLGAFDPGNTYPELEVPNASFRTPGNSGFLDLYSARYGPIEIKSFEPGAKEQAQLSNYLISLGQRYGWLMQVNPYNPSDITVQQTYQKDKLYTQSDFPSRMQGTRTGRNPWQRYLGIREQPEGSPFGSGWDPDRLRRLGENTVGSHKPLPVPDPGVTSIGQSMYGSGRPSHVPVTPPTIANTSPGIKPSTNLTHPVPAPARRSIPSAAPSFNTSVGPSLTDATNATQRRLNRYMRRQKVRQQARDLGSLDRAKAIPVKDYLLSGSDPKPIVRRVEENLDRILNSLNHTSVYNPHIDWQHGVGSIEEAVYAAFRIPVANLDDATRKVRDRTINKAQKVVREVGVKTKNLFLFKNLSDRMKQEVRNSGLLPALYDELITNNRRLQELVPPVVESEDSARIAFQTARNAPYRVEDALPTGGLDVQLAKDTAKMLRERGTIPEEVGFRTLVARRPISGRPGVLHKLYTGDVERITVNVFTGSQGLSEVAQEAFKHTLKEEYGFTSQQADKYAKQYLEIQASEAAAEGNKVATVAKGAWKAVSHPFESIKGWSDKVDAINDAIIRAEASLTAGERIGLKLTTKGTGIPAAITTMLKETAGRLLYGEQYSARALTYVTAKESGLKSWFGKSGKGNWFSETVEGMGYAWKKPGLVKAGKKLSNVKLGSGGLFIGINALMMPGLVEKYDSPILGFGIESARLAFSTVLWENVQHGGIGMNRAWNVLTADLPDISKTKPRVSDLPDKPGSGVDSEKVRKLVKRYGLKASGKLPGLWKIGGFLATMAVDSAIGFGLDMVLQALGLFKDPAPAVDPRNTNVPYDYARGRIEGGRNLLDQSQYSMGHAVAPSGPNYSDFGSKYRPPAIVRRIAPEFARRQPPSPRQPVAGLVNQLWENANQSSRRSHNGSYAPPAPINQGALVA